MEKGPPDLDWRGCGSKGELAVTGRKKEKKSQRQPRARRNLLKSDAAQL